MLPRRKFLDEVAVSYKHSVVTSFELRRSRDVIEWRRLNGGNTHIRRGHLQGLHYVLVPRAVSLENAGVECAIAAVVHSKHDGYYGWLIGEDISGKTQVYGTAHPTIDLVAGPS